MNWIGILSKYRTLSFKLVSNIPVWLQIKIKSPPPPSLLCFAARFVIFSSTCCSSPTILPFSLDCLPNQGAFPLSILEYLDFRRARTPIAFVGLAWTSAHFFPAQFGVSDRKIVYISVFCVISPAEYVFLSTPENCRANHTR